MTAHMTKATHEATCTCVRGVWPSIRYDPQCPFHSNLAVPASAAGKIDYEPVLPVSSSPQPAQTSIAVRVVSDDTGTYFEARHGEVKHLRRDCKQAVRAVIEQIPDALAASLLEHGAVTIKIAR